MPDRKTVYTRFGFPPPFDKSGKGRVGRVSLAPRGWRGEVYVDDVLAGNIAADASLLISFVVEGPHELRIEGTKQSVTWLEVVTADRTIYINPPTGLTAVVN